MDEGVSVEEAYTMALQEYKTIQMKSEMHNRVAQEQFIETNTVPASTVIEELLREEKKILEEAVV